MCITLMIKNLDLNVKLGFFIVKIMSEGQEATLKFSRMEGSMNSRETHRMFLPFWDHGKLLVY